MTQEQVAKAVGASQSQVSRILGAKALRRSRLLEEVCLYAERMNGGVTAEAVRENDDLIEAMRQVWDGSDRHAKALSSVIRSMAGLWAAPSSKRRNIP
ncbi:hypothetical protein [Hydrogenophaga sp. 5NK40-0174]|uniref:hypothetical protein n=1 Tax=Hydrogenophaga sp. 5NK40-0174 TaxID=3127649 RepID=UPI003342A079